MKRSVLISIAALAFACGGGSHQSDTGGAAAAPDTGAAAAAKTGTAPSGAAATAGTNPSAQAEQTVTLVGCLTGPDAGPAPTGTSGTRARERRTGPPTAATATPNDTGRYMLVDAAPDGADVAGVGANGAGGSGGPLVAGKSNFELDGIPADARADVNKKVRIVGRLDARPATVAAPANGTATGSAATSPAAGGTAAGASAVNGATSNGSAGSGANGAASTGNAGSGVGSAQASGSNSTAASNGASTGGRAATGTATAANAIGAGAGHGNMGAAAEPGAAGDVRAKRLVVETVQRVADDCRDTRPQ